jgi:hypothetical protein
MTSSNPLRGYNMLDDSGITGKVLTDQSYVNVKRCEFSIDAVCERYPTGAPPHVIAQALNITEDEVEARYSQILACIREKLMLP